MSRAGTVHWTSDEDAALKRLVDAGLEYREIAAALGRTYYSVSGRVKTLKITAPKGERVRSRSEARPKRPGGGISEQWPADRIARLRHLRTVGRRTMRDIARILGTSTQAVAAKLRKLRIKVPPMPAPRVVVNDAPEPPEKPDPHAIFAGVRFETVKTKQRPLRRFQPAPTHVDSQSSLTGF